MSHPTLGRSVPPILVALAIGWALFALLYVASWNEGEAGTTCRYFAGEQGVSTSICEISRPGLSAGQFLALMLPVVVGFAALYASIRPGKGRSGVMLAAALLLGEYSIAFLFSWGALYLPVAVLLLVATAVHAMGRRRPPPPAPPFESPPSPVLPSPRRDRIVV